MKFARFSIILLLSLSITACLANIAFTTTGSEGGQITSTPDGWPTNYNNGYDEAAAYGEGHERPLDSRNPTTWTEYGPKRNKTRVKLKDTIVNVEKNLEHYRTELKKSDVINIERALEKAQRALKNHAYDNTRLKKVTYDLRLAWQTYGPVSIEPEDHSIFGIEGVNSARQERKVRRRTHAEE